MGEEGDEDRLKKGETQEKQNPRREKIMQDEEDEEEEWLGR